MAYVLSNEELIMINNNTMKFLRNLIGMNDDEHIILPIFIYVINHKYLPDLNTIKDKDNNNFLHFLCNKLFKNNELLIDLIVYILENNYVDVDSKNIYGYTFLHKLSSNDGIVLLHIIGFIIKNNLMDLSIKDIYGHNFLWSLYVIDCFAQKFVYVINCIKDNELESIYFYCDNSKCLIHEMIDEIKIHRLCDEDKKLYNYLLEEYNKTSLLTKSSKKMMS